MLDEITDCFATLQLFDDDECEAYLAALSPEALRVVTIPLPNKRVHALAQALLQSEDAAVQVSPVSFSGCSFASGF